MSLLLNGDCLEQLNSVDDNSVDFIFCDLPYGQTSCKWDIIVPWEPFWKEIMRVKKINTPVFFTTTTKFGVQLINSAPKKMPFRYDLVWVKSAPAGFLSAKKMPMRKHEMVYAFYEKLPFYDLSSHKHKFVKERDAKQKNGDVYGGEEGKKLVEGKYNPPLPVSVVKEEKKATMINGTLGGAYDSRWQKGHQGNSYDPPLPTSVVKEDLYGQDKDYKEKIYDEKYGKKGKNQVLYDPPLPTSVVKEEDKGCYGEKVPNSEAKYGQKCARQYDPPLPTSVVKEEGQMVVKNKSIYHNKEVIDYKERKGGAMWEPPLPTSVVKEESYDNGNRKGGFGGEQKGLGTIYQDPALISSQDVHKKNGLKSLGYDPPLPTSVVKEEDKYCDEIVNDNIIKDTKHGTNTYNTETGRKKPLKHTGSGAFGGEGPCYDPPLPVSVVKEEDKSKMVVPDSDTYGKVPREQSREMGGCQVRYDPPLPTTMLEIKSTRGKHSTEKPVALMEWLLKYYSKEGDTVLDPTMGSGSTGVACKNMKRNFIGIEKDPDIYQVAVNRIED